MMMEPKPLEFSDDDEYQETEFGVSFYGSIDRRRVTNRITRDALHDYCDWQIGSEARVAAFERYRVQIQEVARRLVAAHAKPNEYGGVDICTDDIRMHGGDMTWKAGPV